MAGRPLDKEMLREDLSAVEKGMCNLEKTHRECEVIWNAYRRGCQQI